MRTRFLAALLLAAGCGPLRTADMTPSAELARLGEDYWEFLMRESPTWATYLGDFRYNDRLPDLSVDGRARRRAAARAFLDRLDRVDEAALDAQERVTADLLRLRLERSLEEERFRFWQWDVDQMGGPQAQFPQIMNYHPLSDEAGLLARFRAFPVYMEQYLDGLREGVREGRTAARVAVERVIGQLEALLARPPEESPFAARPAFVPAVRESVYPAYRRMLEYLKEEYLPRARAEDVGLWALPDGQAAYAFRIRVHTTTRASAEEIHRAGLEELRAIRAEMRAIAGDDVKAFRERLRDDPRRYFDSREEIVATATAQLERAWKSLPDAFLRLPRVGCEVKPIEEYREKDAVAAFYYAPDEKLARKGIYYVNTYRPERRFRPTLMALTAHEAVPGHHLQIALAMEIEDLPRFRRHGGFTVFVEGWALYAERLADELGLYENDLERFGMLTYQAWRACRLVVDTGIHALRWTRQQAIDFFLEHVGLEEAEIVNEVDRYIIWPGQALAYMTGKREIVALRKEAEEALGPRFDRREFHDVVLRHGAVPLTTLRKLVTAWIDARRP